MATIYTTKVVYKAVSSQTIYSFGFDYLNKTFVKVKLGGQDLTYLQDYTVDEKTINLTNQPTQGVDLEIYRSTSTEQEVQWEDSSVFRANTLNLFQTQLLHISQEALDGIRKASLKQDEVTSKWDAEGIQINNVGDPQESKDAVNLRYLSNLQDGYITQVKALITNAKNVAEADHRDYLNRFMALLANAQGQANRAESEATRAYNEAHRAEGYAKTVQDNKTLVESYKNTVETLKNETKSNADNAKQSLSSVRAIEAGLQETLTAEQVNAESVRQEATQAISKINQVKTEGVTAINNTKNEATSTITGTKTNAINEVSTAITNATTTLDTRYAGAEQFVTEARQIRSEVAIDKNDTLSYKKTATEQAQLAKQYADKAEQISTGGLDYITKTEATNTFATKTGTGASGTWGINISGNADTATNADKLDGYHEDSFLRYRGKTTTPGEDTLWSQIGIKSYAECLPEGVTGTYNYGAVVSLPAAGQRLDIWYNHNSSYNGNGLWYRSGYSSEKRPWVVLLDTGNYNKYAPTKTGTGASGTWDISISGTATKATQDGNGNVISDTYLKKAGDTVTGTLNVPTQVITDNSTKVASTAFVQSAVDNKVSKLVNSAPATLDTLNELANALGNDPNFATTVSKMIGQKADKTVVDNIENELLAHYSDSTAHTAILNAIKAISGMSSYDTAPSKTIASIIPLLGFGGIVAQKLEDNGYIKFANGLTLQFGLTGDIPKNSTYRVSYPIAFTLLLYAGGFATINGDAGNTDQIKMYNLPNQYNMTLLNTADNYTARTYWLAIGLI